MRNATARKRQINTLCAQKHFASSLMLGTVTVEFVRVQDLAGIMKRHPDPDEVRIMWHAQTLKVRQEQFSRLADQANMGEEGLRGTQPHKEIMGGFHGIHAEFSIES
jgi:hypothetical protein